MLTSVPSGHTVSRWPRHQACEAGPSKLGEHVIACRSRRQSAGRSPRERGTRTASRSPQRLSAARSSLGDSAARASRRDRAASHARPGASREEGTEIDGDGMVPSPDAYNGHPCGAWPRRQVFVCVGPERGPARGVDRRSRIASTRSPFPAFPRPSSAGAHDVPRRFSRRAARGRRAKRPSVSPSIRALSSSRPTTPASASATTSSDRPRASPSWSPTTGTR